MFICTGTSQAHARRKYRYDLCKLTTLSICFSSSSFLFVFSKAQRLRTLGTSQGPYLAVQTHIAMHGRRVRMPHGRITVHLLRRTHPETTICTQVLVFMHTPSQARAGHMLRYGGVLANRFSQSELHGFHKTDACCSLWAS